MKNVAVTGASGYIGAQLIDKLEQQDDVKNIIGIDVKPPRSNSSKLKYCSQDIREPLSDILAENEVDTAVHLAFVVTPTRDQSRARDININGGRNFIESCRKAKVEHVLYLSSHTVYGPHRDNPPKIAEDTALRPPPSFNYSCEKAEVDLMFQEFSQSQSDTGVTILRTCSVVGPQAGVAGINVLFMPVMVRPMGYNPPWQFIHEDDLVHCLNLLLSQRQRGIFNIGGDGSLTYKEMIAAAHRPCVVLPCRLLSLLISLTWKLHLQSSSPSGTDFMMYPIIVDAEKLQTTLGYRFRHDSHEALFALLGDNKAKA